MHKTELKIKFSSTQNWECVRLAGWRVCRCEAKTVRRRVKPTHAGVQNTPIKAGVMSIMSRRSSLTQSGSNAQCPRHTYKKRQSSPRATLIVWWPIISQRKCISWWQSQVTNPEFFVSRGRGDASLWTSLRHKIRSQLYYGRGEKGRVKNLKGQ